MLFEKLPGEVLDHIISLLDSPPPSQYAFNALPKIGWLGSKSHDLKNVSLSSSTLRLRVLPRLFKHIRCDLINVSRLIRGLEHLNLLAAVDSVTLLLEHGGPDVSYFEQLRALCASVPFSTLTLSTTTKTLGCVIGIQANVEDVWVFSDPLQLIQLECIRSSARIDADAENFSIISMRPWHTLRVNEGSSLSAYTLYEYFMRKPPSILVDLYLQLEPQLYTNIHDIVPASPETRAAIQTLLGRLQHFSYIAVFPFYNHADNILKATRSMPQLKTLYIKLCPEPDTDVIRNAIRATDGKIDMNDPWSEFNTSCRLIAHHVQAISVAGCLQQVTMDDVSTLAVKESIEIKFSQTLQPKWHYDGRGTWTKRTVAETMEAELGPRYNTPAVFP